MKKTFSILLVILVLSALLLSACGGGDAKPASSKPEVPADYKGKTNPFAGNAEAAAAGKTLYETDCASCHGDKGMGDGPAGASLKPPASKLVGLVQSAGADYAHWRISEGGSMAPFNSSMPAWKGILTDEEVWKVVSHLETLK